jgi:hypothetical protein
LAVVLGGYIKVRLGAPGVIGYAVVIVALALTLALRGQRRDGGPSR